MFFRLTLLACLSTLLALPALAELLPPKLREPQFPLKTQRMLRTDADIAIARENMAKYPTAQAIADKITSRADAWLAWEDDALRALITSADVPRAFNVGTSGCPQCGQQIYEKGGTYPWIIDPKLPFKVKCPVDGSVYPSNDYAAYYADGLRDQSLLTGDYADDGRGWLGPDGQRNWFVAYANHWTWRNHVEPALHYLSRAYLLTGDERYARKAILLLDRIAEVYPNMDYHPQSRYGGLQEANGVRYEGKILNHIWETGTLTGFAEAYDYVWDAITDDSVPGKTSEAVRANIEANLLEEGIDAYFSGKIRGNFGMHQKALVYAGLVRQFGKQEEWFDGLLNEGQSIDSMTGLNYALYNLVYRDGPPYETSPGYNFSWVVNITTVAEALKRAGYDVYKLPKMRALYDGVLDIVNAGEFTPALGDSGSYTGGRIGNSPFVYQSAWRAYGDSRYRDQLTSFGATGEKGIRDFESLFSPVVEPSEPNAPAQRSRLLDGYGMAILNNPSDTISLSLYYGYKGGHGHYDRLHFSLFAHSEVLMPDLGYPDFMNAYVPGIFTWSKNTISHNTVTVDATRQLSNKPGTVHRFVDEDYVRVLDIDASNTYPQTTEYRRRMMLIDATPTHSYAVDTMSVAGGRQHDYSLHGTPGTFQTPTGNWSEPAPGTLAGPEVPLGSIYDDPRIAVEGFTGSYADYKGSGFQHFQNVRRLEEGPATGEWLHAKNTEAGLRIHLISESDTVFHTQAQVSPVKQKTLVDYLIARNTDVVDTSHFLSVLEPFTTSPWITGQERLALTSGSGQALRVQWSFPEKGEWTDVILINHGGAPMTIATPPVETDAAFALLRFHGGKEIHRWSTGGTFLRHGEDRSALIAPVTGTVARVEPATGRIHIAGASTAVETDQLIGRYIHFQNAIRRTTHPIAAVETVDDGLVITVEDDLHVGRVMVGKLDDTGFTTATGLAFAPVYDGTYVTDTKYTAMFPIQGLASGTVTFTTPQRDTPFVPGEDAWIINVGPGDQVEIPLATVR